MSADEPITELAAAVAELGALPMPVGTGPQARSILDRARDALSARMTKDDLRLVLENVIDYAAGLEAEWHSTNEALDDAVQALRARPNFFQPGHTYAARAGWPGGRERFRFICESVTTDPETGEPRAFGQHGRRNGAREWVWTPNPRTHDDWRGGAWTDITDELAAPPVEESVDELTRLLAPTQALLEDPHDSPLHHPYRVGRDLPETGGAPC